MIKEKLLENLLEEDFIKFSNITNDLKEEISNIEDYINVNKKEASIDLINESLHLKELLKIEKQKFELYLKKHIHLNINKYIEKI